MKALTAALVDAQLRKMELKFRHFEELEVMLEQQQRRVQEERKKLLRERLEFMSHRAQVMEVSVWR